jgi:hypothetical protein
LQVSPALASEPAAPRFVGRRGQLIDVTVVDDRGKPISI